MPVKFEKFDLHESGVTKLYLVTDCFMLDDVSDTQTLDAAYNLGICERLADKLEELIERQTPLSVETQLVTAGLQAGPSRTIAATDETQGQLLLPVIARDNSSDDNMRLVHNRVSANLSQQILNYGRKQDYLARLQQGPQSDILTLALNDNEVVMYVQLIGLKANPTTQNVQIALAMLSAGTAVYLEQTAVSATAVILDREGKVRWADVAIYTSEVASDCKVHSVKSLLLGEFPLAGLDPESKAKTRECWEGDPRGMSVTDQGS
ncbi:hypothetical protein KJI95_06605 [Shewanella sp. JM162201]|uniref:Uncharacterized protein n=1 Tax=Shewanella jiangmenensis TaxID=2837387 RepID=A0ABS5V191_9GAMM|nr:hypothetical protein [Shewanella jiangmenensis]MBT1444195.1 hypothetical protein [Shewanella jiangmenensis]